MTLQLSALFRYTLQAPRAGLVTLGEELVIVQGYLAIEQERLGARLTSEVDVDAALHDLRHSRADGPAAGRERDQARHRDRRRRRIGDACAAGVRGISCTSPSSTPARDRAQSAGHRRGARERAPPAARHVRRAQLGDADERARRDGGAGDVPGERGVTVRAVIVDDEPLARTRLRRLLAEHPAIEVVGEAGDGEAACRLIDELVAGPGLPGRPDAGALGLRRAGAARDPAARDLHHRARRVRRPRLRGTGGRLPAEAGRAGAARARARARHRRRGAGGRRPDRGGAPDAPDRGRRAAQQRARAGSRSAAARR